MIKEYTCDISKFTGYRFKVEQSNLNSYKKLKVDGFQIMDSSYYYIDYQVDIRLIRKLKILALNDLIRKNSVEDRIIQLLDRSKEMNDIHKSKYNLGIPYPYITTSSGTYYYDDESTAFDKDQMKERIKYQSKNYNQKIKQYAQYARRK